MPHGDHHGHRHDHGRGHVAALPADLGSAFAVGIALNAGFVAAELGFGLVAHSTALVADAAHNLGDVLGLALAWGASLLARRKPSPRLTYGYGRSSILAALANAVVLLVSIGAIAVEAVQRLIQPEPVAGVTVIVVALIGIAVNGVTALLFRHGREADLNVQGAFLHMAADAAVSAGVAASGLAILFTGWTLIDPLVSLGIAIALLGSTWDLLRRSVGLAMDAVPDGVDRDAVEAHLRAMPGVAALHDLHIWSVSTTEVAMTTHLVCRDGAAGDAFLARLRTEMRERFNIRRVTVQVESGDPAHPCLLAQSV